MRQTIESVKEIIHPFLSMKKTTKPSFKNIFFKVFVFTIFFSVWILVFRDTEKNPIILHQSVYCCCCCPFFRILNFVDVFCLVFVSDVNLMIFFAKKWKGQCYKSFHTIDHHHHLHTIIINISQPNQTKPNTRYRTTTQKYLVENCTFSLFFWFGYFNSDWLAD